MYTHLYMQIASPCQHLKTGCTFIYIFMIWYMHIYMHLDLYIYTFMHREKGDCDRESRLHADTRTCTSVFKCHGSTDSCMCIAQSKNRKQGVRVFSFLLSWVANRWLATESIDTMEFCLTQATRSWHASQQSFLIWIRGTYTAGHGWVECTNTSKETCGG